MNDLDALMRSVQRYALWFMLICALTGAVFPASRAVALGLVLGTAVSVLNARILQRRTHKFIELVIANKRKRMSLGFTARVLVVLIATMIAYKAPAVNLAGMAGGLVFVPLAQVVAGIIVGLRNQ